MSPTASADSISAPPPAEDARLDLQQLLERTRALAAQLATAPPPTTSAFLQDAFQQLGAIGVTTASLPRALGGVGLGTEPNTHLALLQLLATVGGIDLSLGRLLEGHLNGLILAGTFGTSHQLAQLATDIHAGKLSGVWNTGSPQPLRLQEAPTGLTFVGNKTFASGCRLVERPIVTAEIVQGDRRGWQMVLLRLESPELASHLRIDDQSWQPLGMEASGSFTVDFTGGTVAPSDLLGEPADFYRDPLFRGGAIRFAAVHAGAVLRLHQLFAEWLDAGKRDADPYQIARLGELTLLAQGALLWVEQAAAVAERGLSLTADKFAAERTVEFANTMRLAMERLATAAMAIVVPGVGARGLLRPHRFEQILRDLTTYLRQPAPDATLADVGRASMRSLRLHRPLLPWSSDSDHASLSPAYFDEVYRDSTDPWSFETSPYEAAKYADTLANLPRPCFATALEVGCSIGVLTEQLAEHCDSLLSVDVSDRALAIARKRLAGKANVRFERLQLPREMPDGNFSLILVSEVAYYWQRDELERAATVFASRQQPGDVLVLVHLTEFVPDYPLTGDQVHEAWIARPEWRVTRAERRERYRLDVLERQ